MALLIIGVSVVGKRKGGKKFHAQSKPYHSDKKIYEKTAMQGSCWLMRTDWWRRVIGKLDEAYGTHYQDSTEMLFKTWQAGGKLMVNTNTWYAHKAKEFPRTHNYPRELAEASFKYAMDKWRDYYKEFIAPKARGNESIGLNTGA